MKTACFYLSIVLALSLAASSASASATPVWQFNFTTPQSSTNPVVANGLVYVPTNTTLHALNLTTGATVWTFDYSIGDHGGYAAVNEKYIYVGTMNGIYALTLEGAVRWVWPNPYSATVHFMRPSIGQDGVYVTTGYAPLMKLSHADAVIQWFAPAALGNAQLHATEEQTGSFVYVVTVPVNSSVGVAACLSTASGAYQWNVSGVVTIIVSDATGYLFAQGGNALQSTITAVRLIGGSFAFAYLYEGMQSLDYYLYETTLYVNIGATGAAYPTSLIQYNAVTGAANWQVNNVSFLYFIPCAVGVVMFETTSAVAYSAATGEVQWRYSGVAVNDGAMTTDCRTVMITQSSVILLPTF